MQSELWQKTPFSNPNGECMEARWVKSPFSNPSGCCLETRFQAYSRDGECAEARWAGGWVETRNSKDPDGPVIRYTPGEWRAFLRGVRESDVFDLPSEVALMFGEAGSTSIGGGESASIGFAPRWPAPWWKGTPQPVERFM